MPSHRAPSIGTILFLLFTIVPIVELALLVYLATITSFWFTLAVIIVSGLVGAVMAREQGIAVWVRAQREMQAGRFPADSLIDGVIILIGGALLVTPGVLTDLVGFSTLIPPLRAAFRQGLKRHFRSRVRLHAMGMGGGSGFRVYTAGGFGGMGPGPVGGGEPQADAEAPPEHSPFEDTSPFGRR